MDAATLDAAASEMAKSYHTCATMGKAVDHVSQLHPKLIPHSDILGAMWVGIHTYARLQQEKRHGKS